MSWIDDYHIKLIALDQNLEFWRNAAIHIAGLGTEHCDVNNCDWCRRTYDALHDTLMGGVRHANRGDS